MKRLIADLLILAAVVGICFVLFNPVTRARIKGESHIFETGTLDTEAKPFQYGKADVMLKNISNEPIKVSGVQISCSCTSLLESLPLEIPAGGIQTLHFLIGGRDADSKSSVNLFVSDPKGTGSHLFD